MKKFYTIVLFLLTSNLCLLANGSRGSFEMELFNLVQVNETALTFDVRLKNTTGEDWALSAVQFFLQFNDFRNGGIFHNTYLTYLDGTTQLQGVTVPQSGSFTVNAAQNMMQWNSAPVDDNAVTTLFPVGVWIKLGTFKIQLRDATNSNFHNFADMFHNLRISDIIVTKCGEYATNSGVTTRVGPVFVQLFGSFATNVSQRQLAGYYFSGDGNWEDTGRWNNVTTQNANALPGPNSNMLINGNAVLNTNVSLLPDGAGNGGELTILTGEEPLYTLTVTTNPFIPSEIFVKTRQIGDGNPWLLGDASTWALAGSSIQLPAGTTVRVYASVLDDLSPYHPDEGGAFVNWTNDAGVPFTANTESDGRFFMPASNIAVTANYTSAKSLEKGLELISNLPVDIQNLNAMSLIREEIFFEKLNRGIFSSLSLGPLGALTVDKLFNDSENGMDALVLKSTAVGTGSLIYNIAGTPDIEARSERFIQQVSSWPTSADGWFLVSSPVAQQAIEGSWVPGYPDNIDNLTNGYDFYLWDETILWRNQKNPANDGLFDNFTPGKGYLVAYQNAEAKMFSGKLNFGNVTFPLVNTAQIGGDPVVPWDWDNWVYNNGWNLMGNPYPSGIDWHEADRSNFDDFAYIYRNAGEEWHYVDGTIPGAYIPAHQGFFVWAQPYADGNTFTFSNAMRAHGGTFQKGNPDTDILVLGLANETHYDNTTIRLRQGSSFGRDRSDAAKMFSYNPAMPQLFSHTANDVRVAINTMPEITADTEIKMGIRVPETGAYSINLDENIGVFHTTDIYLTDLLTGSVQNLRNEPEFGFFAQKGDDFQRFLLTFRAPVNVDELTESTIKVHVWENTLFLGFKEETGSKNIEIFDTSGRMVMSKFLGHSLQHSEKLYLNPGIYIVRVTTQNGFHSQKVLIK